MNDRPIWQPMDLDEVTARLGEPEAVYSVNRSLLGAKLAACAVLFGMAAYMVAGKLAGVRALDSFGPCLEYGAAICIGSAIFIWYLLRTWRDRVLVYQAGLVLVYMGWVGAVLWEDLATVEVFDDPGRTVGITDRHGECFYYDREHVRGGRDLTLRLHEEAERRAVRWIGPVPKRA